MAFSNESTINEVLTAKPQARAIFERQIGRPLADYEISMAAHMTLQTVTGYIGLSQEQSDSILQEINTL